MNNNTFNARRFALVLKKELVENKRTLLLLTLGGYAALTLFMVMGNLLTPNPPGELLLAIQIGVFSLGSLTMNIMASLMYRQLRTKEGSINLLILPASTLEKWLANILLYFVMPAIAYFAIAQLADLSRYALMGAIKGFDNTVGPLNFVSEPLTHGLAFTPGWTGVAQIVAGCLLGAAVYALGSVLWPRFTFIKVMALEYAVEVTVIIAFALLILALGKQWAIDLAGSLDTLFSSELVLALLVLAVAGLLWLNYHLLKKRNIIMH